jgi:hypothetical protein
VIVTAKVPNLKILPTAVALHHAEAGKMSRAFLLQVTIFSIPHKDVKLLDFNTLLPNGVTIADEVDAQLKQQMLWFVAADMAKLIKRN